MAVKMLTLNSRAEWLAKRNSYIGGSDASSVVGMNPYKTNVELWEIKQGIKKPANIDDNPFVEYGRNAEEYLRELFKLDFPQYKVDYVENNLFLNDALPWAHASLDGWITDEVGRLGVLEIKTTNILQSLQLEKWRDRIPDNYYIQVLHYMAVVEADFAILKAQLKFDYDGEVFLKTNHYRIERAEVSGDIDILMKSEKEFFDMIQSGEKPALILPAL